MSGKAKIKYFLIRVMFKTAGRLAVFMPESLTYRFCVGLALLGYRYVPRFRKLARGHLEIAFGNEKSPEEIESILKQAYINQGKNLAEFLMIPYKSAAWIQRRIDYNDPNRVLDTELAKGCGVIAVGAHIGNNELACAWIGINKLPMVTVVKAQRDALITEFIMETRRKWDTKMLYRAVGVKAECLKQLGDNKIIGLVADQNTARNGVFVDFFGKKAATATGPADIAMKTGLPVVPSFFSTRNPDNTLTIHILDPIPMRNTGDRESDILHNVQLYTKVIEEFIRKYPSEYLWWHQRWKTQE